MDLKKILGFGVVFWILMFVIVSVFIAFKLYPGGTEVLIAVIAGVVSYILAGFAKPKDRAEALKFGISWVIVGVVLDALITLRFSPGIFQMWTLWLGYALVLLAPTLKVKQA